MCFPGTWGSSTKIITTEKGFREQRQSNFGVGLPGLPWQPLEDGRTYHQQEGGPGYLFVSGCYFEGAQEVMPSCYDVMMWQQFFGP